MRTRQEIEEKIAEINATATGTGSGLSHQNSTYRDELSYALESVDSQAELYGWEATAAGWANGDIETLRIEGSEPPGEGGPNA